MNANIGNQKNFVRPYLIAVSLTVAGYYVWWLSPFSLYNLTLKHALITGVLLIIYLLGCWSCVRLPSKRLPVYVSLQSVAIFLIGTIGQGMAISAVLSMILVSSIVIFYDNFKWAIFTHIICLSVIFLTFIVSNYLLLDIHAIIAVISGEAIGLIGAIPFYGVLYLQMRSRRLAQHMFRELDKANRKLVVYAEQVEQLTLSVERARMARELHDTLVQGVAGMSLQLEGLGAYLEQGNIEKSQQIVAQIKSRARAALSDSRRAIDELRMVSDRPEDLLGVIREEAERFSAATGIPCVLDLPPRLTLQTSIMEHTLRCITEALSNIARHARAKHVFIELNVVADQLTLQIRDDGIGFDRMHVPASGHYGLLGLHERARLVGGKLEIESTLGAGTSIQLNCPIK
ncbi:MAG: sensor histidine kinase [Chloroflexota bacterium]